ncbi:c-type cytochrome [Sorangium sp. So ce1153]|uniref:c-type cytochrome n=1 Tax=Sorangium sp. So ce1153 TaxID=3133333 RepID=UPI003F633C44
MRARRFWLIVGALLPLSCGGGGEGSPAPEQQDPQETGPEDTDAPDGDAPDAGPPDGDAPDGDAPDGDAPDAGPPDADPPQPDEVLAVYPVVWSRGDADVGQVASVVDGGETVVVLGSKGAVVLEHGEVASTDSTKVDWRACGVVPAADRTSGGWTVGIDGEGGVFRIRPRVPVESISARYGLEHDVVTAVATSGGKAVFGLEEGVAIADGELVTHYATGPFTSLTASDGGRIALAGADAVQAFELAAEEITTFAVPGAAHVAFDPEGRLVAATATSVYRENDDGALALVYEAEEGGPAIHGLAASGSHVWLGIGSELGLLERDAVVRTEGIGLALDARLIAASTGDVWAIAGGELLRFSADASQGEDADSWEAQIRPIVEASCSLCHLPGGPAAIDLSTYAAWVSHRTAIRQRVVVERDMPPPGIEFSESDREIIAAWIDGVR